MNAHLLRSWLAAALALAAVHALAQAPAPAGVTASTPASAPATAVRITETTDPARAAAALERARAIGDRNARVAATGGPPPSATLLRASTEEGQVYLLGGVTVDDRQTMRNESGAYSLWVATVARPSGAFLADAQIVITRVGAVQPLLQRPMDGPWLMLALPPGRYEVKASRQAHSTGELSELKQVVTVPAKGQRQVMLRFPSKVDVSPDGHDPREAKMFPEPPARKP